MRTYDSLRATFPRWHHDGPMRQSRRLYSVTQLRHPSKPTIRLVELSTTPPTVTIEPNAKAWIPAIAETVFRIIRQRRFAAGVRRRRRDDYFYSSELMRQAAEDEGPLLSLIGPNRETSQLGELLHELSLSAKEIDGRWIVSAGRDHTRAVLWRVAYREG